MDKIFSFFGISFLLFLISLIIMIIHSLITGKAQYGVGCIDRKYSPFWYWMCMVVLFIFLVMVSAFYYAILFDINFIWLIT
jgi:hypothetical protein